MESRPGSPLDDDVAFSVNTTIEEFREKPDRIAMDLLRIIFFSVNWPGIVAKPQDFIALIRKGYKYNFWNDSAELSI